MSIDWWMDKHFMASEFYSAIKWDKPDVHSMEEIQEDYITLKKQDPKACILYDSVYVTF